MKLIIENSVEKVSKIASEKIVEALGDSSGPFGVATGSTPTPIYGHLSRAKLNPEMKLFALDEYFEIDPEHPSSFRQTLIRELVTPCGFSEQNLYMPPSNALKEDIQNFEQALHQLGPVKIQLLGIGTNGHVAFNEPGSPRDSRTRKVGLQQQTLSDNQKIFGGDVPTEAVTQGIGTIMSSEQLLLVATGEKKANAIGSMFGIGAPTPASFLASHENLTVVCDSAAASLVPEGLKA